MYYLKENDFIGSKSYLYIIPTIALLSTGARTFLIPIAIIIVLILYKKYGFWKITIPGIIFFPMIPVLFKKTSIYDKFLYLIELDNSRSLISNLTSGRSDVWESCMYHYINSYNFFEKLIGTSFDQVYTIINSYTNMNIWAHNDLVNTIMSSGILGVIVYLYAFIRIIKVMRLNNISKKYIGLFYFIYGFMILTNGLFILIPVVFSMIIFIQTFSGGVE